MNDQNPFDVAPDDERRPAADAAHPEAPSADATAPLPTGPTAAAADAPVADTAASDGTEQARRKHHRFAALGIAAAVIFTAGAGGGAVASLALARSTTATSADGGSGFSSGQGGTGAQGGTNGSQGFGGQGFGGSQGGFGRFGQGSQGGQSGQGSSGSSDSGSTTATAAQVKGLVTIVSQLGYESGEAAGTGIILTSNGRILTNNHVIDGSTAIEVTDESTGRSYAAKVVGTNATKDVAVLQLEDASGLTPADIATSDPSVGDGVTAVGNANGTGTLSAATGEVSALGQTITTSSEGSAQGETLHDLIEISADVVSGDSGGAVENEDGDVVGVTTAASSGSADVTGYAIPIDAALGIARQIVAGDDTSEITIGLPAFLGVSLDPTETDRAVVGEVLSGTAAADTALAKGDVITKVDGTTISASDALSAAIKQHAPSDRVTITWTDADGGSRTATVTLTAGPAD
ncbi:S1C family serine protease [Amnibacterium setariae]|uniref:S1C family serine protease n=1 Tax=Amnibacterium setariae TaxID=2306585 RepID=UPI0011C4477F|nr:trypsin-like peptidase domain-containing protein [Amnibacterium setariae]